MGEYRFKPALVRGEQTWVFDEGTVSGPSVDSLTLADAESIRFIDSRAKRMANAQLKVTTATQTANIICNEFVYGQNRRQFLDLAKEIFSYLAREMPEMRVKVGFPKLARIGISITGVFLAFVGVAIANSSSSSPSTVVLVLGLGMVAAGGWIVWSYAPWRPGPSISVSEAFARVNSAD